MSLQPSPHPDDTSPGAVWTRRLVVALTGLAWVAILYVVFVTLERVGSVFLLYLISAAIAFILYPVARWLSRFLPRVVAVLLILLTLIALVAAFAFTLGSAIVTQAGQLIATIQAALQPEALAQNQFLNEILSRLGLSLSDLKLPTDQLAGLAGQLLGSVTTIITGTISSLINIVAAITIITYLLLDGDRFIAWLRGFAPTRWKPSVNFMLDTLDKKMGGFLRGQVIIVFIVTVILGSFALAIGLPFAALFIVIVFLFQFIPVLGGYVSGTIGILLGFSKDPFHGLLMLVAVALMFGVIEGQVLIPRITGKAVEVHPLLVLAGLFIGAELFGVVGAIFAPPLVGVLDVVTRAIWDTYRYRNPDKFVGEEPIAEPPPLIPEPVEATQTTETTQTTQTTTTVVAPRTEPEAAP